MFRIVQFFICFFCLAVSSAFGNLLKERIQNASQGDYIVVEQNKIVTILSIHSINSKHVTLEEISIPSAAASKIKNWKKWIKKSAPGHSSWVMYEIDLKTDQITECFSFSKSAWLKLSQQDYWLACLFQIPLQKVATQDRRKIGSPPMEGDKDYRATWNPPMVFESKPQAILSDAFRGVWPDDGTQLAKKRFEIFFDQKNLSSFPCWIQVSNPHITMNIRVIDAGKNLKSIYKSLPKRPPEFLRNTQKTTTGYRLHLSSPEYYKDCFLYVRDLSDPQKRITQVSFQSKRNQEDVIVEVPFSSLKGLLQPSHVYSWVFSPKDFHSIHAESKDSFLWEDLD